MTITIGSWIFPLAITIGLFLFVHFQPGVGRYRAISSILAAMIIAIPGSLTAWLIWALVMWWLA